MKLIGVLLLALCFTGCLADYSKQEVKAITKAGKQCMQQLSIPPEDNVIERVMYNRGAKKEDMVYAFCAMKLLGLMDEEGTILTENVVTFLADKYEQEKVRRLVSTCAKKMDSKSIYEGLWKYYQCFFGEMDFEL